MKRAIIEEDVSRGYLEKENYKIFTERGGGGNFIRGRHGSRDLGPTPIKVLLVYHKRLEG